MGKLAQEGEKSDRSAAASSRASALALSKGALYADLKDRILKLELAPGEPISEIAVADHYKVSRTPVREAIQRLLSDKLVDVRAKSGTYVARIPLNLLPQAIVVRKALEGVTTRLAAQVATQSQILELKSRLVRMREILPTGEREQFHLADEAFHSTIARMAGYPGIWTMVEHAKMHVDRYRRVTLPQEGRMLGVIEEHEAVLEAIERHDPDRAVEAMDRHIEALEIAVDEIRRLNPSYFVDEEDLLR